MPSNETSEVVRRLDEAVAEGVRPLGAVLAVLFTLFAVSHPFVLAAHGTAHAALAGASAAFFALVAVNDAVRERLGASGHGRAFVLGCIALANATAMLADTANPIHTTNFLLIEMGAASVMLERRWFAGFIGAVAATWFAVAAPHLGDPVWLHFAFAVASGTAIAVIIFLFRRRNQAALLRYRVRDEDETRMYEQGDLAGELSRYRVLVETASVGMIVLQDAAFVYGNPEAARVIGCDQADLLSGRMTFQDLIHPDDAAYVAEQVRRRYLGETSEAYGFRFRRGDGSYRHIRVFGGRATYRGRPAIAGMFIDVTEMMDMQRDLGEKQRELATLISNLPGIAYRCRNDRDWTMEFMSTGTLSLTGYAPDELIGNRVKSYNDLIEPEDAPGVWRLVQAAVSRREPFRLVYRLRHRDGSRRWVWEQGRGVFAASGELLALEGFITDITERVAAEEREKEASRLKSAILANMSHEIRTPMTAILGFSDLLVRRLKGTEFERDAATINSGARRLLHLLNNVLDLARIEAGKTELERKAHLVHEPLDRVVGLLRVLAEKKHLSLGADYTPGLLVRGDAHAEEQVWTNLIGNAIKFTEHGGVTVRTRREGDHAVVEISDTGVGIGPAFWPHLFEEFRQESEGLNRSFEGSGLGLTISKRLVNALGGEITVASEKGRGTTITVTLPLAPAPAPAETAGETPGTVPAAPRRRTVLVVEDDPSAARLVAAYLEPAHEVLWRDNGADAESAVRERRVDHVLLDINLKSPNEDGLAVMHRLREALGPGAPPMTALTAYAMPGDAERFRAAGFDGYLAKPYDAAELQALIEGSTNS